MTVTEIMVRDAQPIWAEIMECAFIQGIIDGSLSPEKFKHYTIQDTLYIREFVKVYAYGFINSNDIHIMRRFYDRMKSSLADETTLHIRYLIEEYNLTEDEALNYPMEKENEAYTSYMINIAKEGDAKEALAAVMPCVLSYLDIARYIKEKAIENNTHAGSHFELWVNEYASQKYEDACKEITAFMNDISSDCTKEEIKHLSQIFSESSKLELNFWHMSFRA